MYLGNYRLCYSFLYCLLILLIINIFNWVTDLALINTNNINYSVFFIIINITRHCVMIFLSSKMMEVQKVLTRKNFHLPATTNYQLHLQMKLLKLQYICPQIFIKKEKLIRLYKWKND